MAFAMFWIFLLAIGMTVHTQNTIDDAIYEPFAIVCSLDSFAPLLPYGPLIRAWAVGIFSMRPSL